VTDLLRTVTAHDLGKGCNYTGNTVRAKRLRTSDSAGLSAHKSSQALKSTQRHHLQLSLSAHHRPRLTIAVARHSLV
jgi:hypothetical protein